MTRSRRNFGRNHGFLERKKLFVIATEGKRTEPIYFDQFRKSRKASFAIKILPTKNNRSNPNQVIRRLDKYARDNNLSKTDELWLLIDKDDWQNSILDDIAVECKRKGYNLAVSNPCFEYWLYLHLEGPRHFTDSAQCVNTLKVLTGREGTGYKYSKSGYDPAFFMPGLRNAVRHAKTIDLRDNPRYWPRSNGSHVYKLIVNLPEDIIP